MCVRACVCGKYVFVCAMFKICVWIRSGGVCSGGKGMNSLRVR